MVWWNILATQYPSLDIPAVDNPACYALKYPDYRISQCGYPTSQKPAIYQNILAATLCQSPDTVTRLDNIFKSIPNLKGTFCKPLRVSWVPADSQSPQKQAMTRPKLLTTEQQQTLSCLLDCFKLIWLLNSGTASTRLKPTTCYKIVELALNFLSVRPLGWYFEPDLELILSRLCLCLVMKPSISVPQLSLWPHIFPKSRGINTWLLFSVCAFY